MTKREMILTAIENLGYKAKLDDDGDVMMCYQLKTIYFMIGDESENYMSALLPQFTEIQEGEEAVILAICNKLTRDLKLVKVYVDNTFKTVTASCEFFYSDEESLQNNIEHSLNILGLVRSTFHKTRDEFTE